MEAACRGLADAPLDDRRRFDDITDDRVVGVTTAAEVVGVLGARLDTYLLAMTP